MAEIISGHKRTHWMWFIFPQLRGLGQSHMAYKFGVADLTEARAYLAHPLLSSRLRHLVMLVGASPHTPEQIFGQDACKYLSCLTLFSLVDGSFEKALSEQCFGHKCDTTIERLRTR